MADTIGYLFDNVGPQVSNILKFLLIQDSIKVAIGMALGLAFTNLGTTVIGSFIRPMVQTFLHMFSKTGFTYHIFGSTFSVGTILEQILIFIIFVIIVYYLIIIPINNLKVKYNINPQTVACPYCTTLISPEATRCPACTSQLN
jgi:large conductance mechanosensitive channel